MSGLEKINVNIETKTTSKPFDHLVGQSKHQDKLKNGKGTINNVDIDLKDGIKIDEWRALGLGTDQAFYLWSVGGDASKVNGDGTVKGDGNSNIGIKDYERMMKEVILEIAKGLGKGEAEIEAIIKNYDKSDRFDLADAEGAVEAYIESISNKKAPDTYQGMIDNLEGGKDGKLGKVFIESLKNLGITNLEIKIDPKVLKTLFLTLSFLGAIDEPEKLLPEASGIGKPESNSVNDFFKWLFGDKAKELGLIGEEKVRMKKSGSGDSLKVDTSEADTKIKEAVSMLDIKQRTDPYGKKSITEINVKNEGDKDKVMQLLKEALDEYKKAIEEGDKDAEKKFIEVIQVLATIDPSSISDRLMELEEMYNAKLRSNGDDKETKAKLCEIQYLSYQEDKKAAEVEGVAEVSKAAIIENAEKKLFKAKKTSDGLISQYIPEKQEKDKAIQSAGTNSSKINVLNTEKEEIMNKIKAVIGVRTNIMIGLYALEKVNEANMILAEILENSDKELKEALIKTLYISAVAGVEKENYRKAEVLFKKALEVFNEEELKDVTEIEAKLFGGKKAKITKDGVKKQIKSLSNILKANKKSASKKKNVTPPQREASPVEGTSGKPKEPVAKVVNNEPAPKESNLGLVSMAKKAINKTNDEANVTSILEKNKILEDAANEIAEIWGKAKQKERGQLKIFLSGAGVNKTILMGKLKSKGLL